MSAEFWVIFGGVAWTPVAIAIAARVLPAAPPREFGSTAGARAVVGAALGVAMLALVFWATATLGTAPRVVLLLVAHAALGLFLLAYARGVDSANPILELERRGAVGHVLRGLLVYVAFIPIVCAAHILNSWLVGSEVDVVQKTLHDLLHERGVAQIALVLNVVLAVPIFEELTFRGLLQQGLHAHFGFAARPRHAAALAVVLASVAFTALHPTVTYIPVFVLSLILGFAFDRAKSILVAITIHAAHNLAVVLLEVVGATNGSAS